jgi:Uma2 family endonuclease
MAHVAKSGGLYTSDEYFGLVRKGVLQASDRVELLEGVIVAMSPQNPGHASGTTLAYGALSKAVGTRAVIRIQQPLLLSRHSVPEPDVAVVPGKPEDYFESHPRTALLVIEVADTSLAQDRLSKSRMYAFAGIAEYWVVNLKQKRVEVFRDPKKATRTYRSVTTAAVGDVLELVALPKARVRVRDLLPIK